MRFFHTGKPGTKGGTTLGYELLSKGEDGSQKLLITFARCSDHPKSTDMFNKRKGRLICEGRLRKRKYEQVVLAPNQGKYEFFLNLVSKNDEKVRAERGTRKHSS